MFQLMKNLHWQIQESQKKQLNVVFVGLDGAGKTTLCNTLDGKPDRATVPTVGFNKAKMIKRDGFEVYLHDIGGSRAFRKQWSNRMARSHGAIFVLDAADKERILEARDELAQYTQEDQFKGKPVLVFANKQDKDDAMDEVEISQALGLDQGSLSYCTHNVVKCIALKSANGDKVDPQIETGVDWLVASLAKDWQALKKRVAVDCKLLDQKDKEQREETARIVAERKKKRQEQKGDVKKNSVVPDNEKPKVICKNFLIDSNQRIPCTNVAVVRNSKTEWMPFCESCHQLAIAKAAAKEQAEKDNVVVGTTVDTNTDESPNNNENQQQSQLADKENTQRQDQAIDAMEMGGPGRAGLLAPLGKRNSQVLEPLKPPAAKAATADVGVGDAVYALFKGKKWFQGTIQAAGLEPGTFKVVYDDGDVEEAVRKEDIAPLHQEPVSVGTKVECRFRGKGEAYKGVVTDRDVEAGTYVVTYDDGDKDKAALRCWIKCV